MHDVSCIIINIHYTHEHEYNIYYVSLEWKKARTPIKFKYQALQNNKAIEIYEYLVWYHGIIRLYCMLETIIYRFIDGCGGMRLKFWIEQCFKIAMMYVHLLLWLWVFFYFFLHLLLLLSSWSMYYCLRTSTVNEG